MVCYTECIFYSIISDYLKSVITVKDLFELIEVKNF